MNLIIKKFFKLFTLVELIIVIAIISVLGASAFLLVSQWIGKSRDSRRISDLHTLEKTLQISFIDKEGINYPDPDPKIEIKFDNYGIMWFQGKFGQTMTNYVGMLNKVPKDPRGDYYEYSLTQDKKFYQLLAILENEKQATYGIDIANANSYESTYLLTNYKGYLIKKLGAELYLIKTETLMVDPNLINEYTGDYLVDQSNDILSPNDSFDNRVVIITGNITGLLSNDPDQKQQTIDEIGIKFQELNNQETLDEIENIAGIVFNNQSNNLSCESHEYDGYNFDIIEHGLSQTKTKTVNIIDGTNLLQLTANCNNGVITYSPEQSQINCIDGKVVHDGSCVDDLCQGIFPANAQLNGTQGVSGTWGYDINPGLCKFNCIEGYNYQGALCIENNCMADTIALDSRIFNVGAFNHGQTLIVNSNEEMISNGKIIYNQEFQCNKGVISAIGSMGVSNLTCDQYYSNVGGVCTKNERTIGTWGNCSEICGGGIQTRQVECKTTDGTTLTDTDCIEPKPLSSQTCNTQVCVTYSWDTSSWGLCNGGIWSSRGTCSVTCGGGVQYRTCNSSTGTQTRTVVCKNDSGEVVADSYCNGEKPTLSQSCTSANCVGSNSQSCNTQACCTSNSSYSCYGGNVYRYDSCGVRGSIKQTCSNGCSGSSCLTWTQAFYGSYSGIKGNLSATISINSSGTVSGSGTEKYYKITVPAGLCLYYNVNYSTESVVVTPTVGPSTCPRTGVTLTKSQAIAEGGVLVSRNYTISGTVNSSGTFSGTWRDTQSPYGTNSVSGNGVTSSPSFRMNYNDYSGNPQVLTMSK